MKPGPVVVITGGSAGAGRAAARAFAHNGFQVGLLARGVERLEATRAEVEGYGVRCMAISTDVADADAVEDATASIEAGLGPVDVWVNSAMTSVFSPVHQLEAEEVRRVAEVTYLGSVNGILAARLAGCSPTTLSPVHCGHRSPASPVPRERPSWPRRYAEPAPGRLWASWSPVRSASASGWQAGWCSGWRWPRVRHD